ncbi:RNA polymerase sigma factor RpoH [Chitinivorax sp. PXF-14]|uniref:RNA polymerase sigma factor RpoH n=1 Tax=Chitinivorax sp. PXF-14 TaxID=3230488 RepID=UPI003465576B
MTYAMSLPIVSDASSLEHYIQTVNSIPLLSQDEETELAERLQRQNDLEAARKMVMSHLRVVVSIARGYAGYGLPQADLIQEGNIGLMKAVKRFEPNRGVRLFSFAVHWIKAEIHEFILKNWRLVKVATTKSQRKLFFNLRSMKSGLHSLTPNEARDIATQLGVKPEEVLEMEMRMGGQDIALESHNDDGEEAYAPIDWLADEDNEPTRTIERRATDHLHGEGLEHALLSLDDRSRRIVQARWLADDGEGKTLHDLAAEFGVSAERIRQIEAKALQKMKTALMALPATL